MGTKVHCKSYLPGFYPMRDLNENSNSCSWPPYYCDKTMVNGQYYNTILPRAATDLYPGCDKDVVKQTILKHEETFRTQVYELHRLYRIQKDLMDEFKRKELHKNVMPVETLFSSSPFASQITSGDAQKWYIPSFPPEKSVSARPSVSGVEDIHSPLNSMKGNGTQVGPFPSQNGGSSKDLEVLDSRPTKVRRKLIDLQLPADEYIDTEEGEQFSKEKASVMSSYHSNINHMVAPDNGGKLFLGDGGKSGFQGDALKPDTCLESRNCLADLNEPIQVEETNASGNVDPLGQVVSYQTKGLDLSAKPNLQFHSLPKGISLKSHHESDNGTRNSWHLESNGNGKGWFDHVLEAGHSKNDLKSGSQVLQPEVSSQPMQVLLKVHEPSAYHLTDQSKVGLWNERTVCALEIPDRSHEISSSKHLGSMVTSHMPSPYPIVPSSDLAKSWSHSVSSWEKQSSSLSQKSISGQKQPCLNSSAASLSKSCQSSVQSNGFFGDAWHLKSNSSCNPGSGNEVPNRNGFYQGSPSGSKELSFHLPSISYDYLNCVNDHNRAPDQFSNNSFVKYSKGSDYMDMKSVKDESLNVALPNHSSNKVAPRQGFEIVDGGQKHEDHLSVLPWLRPKPSSKNETSNAGRVLNTEELSFLQSSPSWVSNKNEMEKGINHIFPPNIKLVSCSNDVEIKRIEIGDYPTDRKILGFPICEKSHISENESCSFTSPSMSLPLSLKGEVVENNWKNRDLDMNLPCEPAVPDFGQIAEIFVKDKKTDANVSIFRHNIDLNSCISDDEASLLPSIPSTNVKITAGIDLEAPVVAETKEDAIHGDAAEKQHDAPLQLEQHNIEHPQDELMMVAAEAIISISTSCLLNQFNNVTSNPSAATVTDNLNWFAEIVSSYGQDIEGKCDAVLRVKDSDDNEEEGSDYFESMTLKLMETKEEDYMPKPLVPESLKLEETGTTVLTNRPRKGQARRGRQRRDFQRDILPGLASLSRHEVTEDLQTFGGLMRATGHSWHSGLTRRSSTRNGCGRGRRRSAASTSPTMPASPACTPLIQQLNNTEVGLEDRSLAGWGKTTRRPRRQRCPAGNHALIPLT
ncbi:uncharacterized protein LOC122313294 [Carya illinoinensis]|uniref:Uncharacterized protein n=2 Tax=Carya illinoinensis TaxID=32201 RepID=A0A8T1Q9X4_CARIL|nr:uncharacterized protein LOC122313294 [Carya illinoinensis]KAG6651122.1 hypothetical protein CIPAW_06G089900 [Carya illinoinensis]KAG6651124.1 hypothetical protein CIPAW_06G089900 [Carya illinoinensis]KAG6651125.1 hypothetical protein CIPAW_06G089900 [Carya illinoinensis]